MSYVKKAFLVITILFLFAGCSAAYYNTVVSPGKVEAGTPQVKKMSAPGVVTLTPNDDIQAAIDSASDGDTIVFRKGSYTFSKPVVISGMKDITLEGQGVVWLNVEGNDRQVITIRDSDNILLKNIKAQHVLPKGQTRYTTRPKNLRDGSVVGAYTSKKLYFENCEFVGCGKYGIFAENTGEINIDGCYIHHNSVYGLGFMSSKGVMNVRVENSRIVNNAGFIEKIGNVKIVSWKNNTIGDNDKEGFNKGK